MHISWVFLKFWRVDFSNLGLYIDVIEACYTQEILKSKPVRIFGRKPQDPASTKLPVDELGELSDQVIDLDPDLAHQREAKNILKGMSEKEIQDAYEADTDIDSDTTEDYEFWKLKSEKSIL